MPIIIYLFVIYVHRIGGYLNIFDSIIIYVQILTIIILTTVDLVIVLF